MRNILLLASIIFLMACHKEEKNESLSAYFPPDHIFEKGYAVKYYSLFKPNNPDQESAIRISYVTYHKSDASHFSSHVYNAGFELTGSKYSRIEGDDLYLDSSFYYPNEDTLKVEIIAAHSKSWQPGIQPLYIESYQYQSEAYRYEVKQEEMGDTNIAGEKAKYFVLERSYRNVKTDSVVSSNRAIEIYRPNIGFWSSYESSEGGSYSGELIEQMPLDTFLLRADHGEKRVAYIDPAESLGGDADFKLCGSEKAIADYYNGDPDAGFLYGKKKMLSIIKQQLKEEKLGSEDGMLTYRFVISCEGKAGRFIAQGYDFDYQAKDFEAPTVNHLLDILLSLKTWQPCVIRGENRDSYAYLTFKIKDNEIIDILP